jgi:ATP-dependent helicase/nuclease subunit A
VTEFLERNQDDDDVELLAQIWSRDQLVDVLAGLLDERPQSESVLEAWRDAEVDDYVDICWEVVCDLDVADARHTLYADGLLEHLRTVAGRVDREGAIADEDGLRAYRTFTEVATTLPDDPGESDSRDCQWAILELYEACEKKNGGLYSSSGHVVGDRDGWGEYGDVYDDLKDAIGTVIDAVEPHADAVETTSSQPTPTRRTVGIHSTFPTLSRRRSSSCELTMPSRSGFKTSLRP